jgi:hypothetical protein
VKVQLKISVVEGVLRVNVVQKRKFKCLSVKEILNVQCKTTVEEVPKVL